MNISKKCDELGVILITLYPNSTHVLQPLDCAVFRGVKAGWTKLLIQKRRENGNFKITMLNFSELLLELLRTYHNPDAVRNGFKVCGIYEWNVDNIDFSKLLSSNTPKKVKESEVVVPSEELNIGDAQQRNEIVIEAIQSESRNECEIVEVDSQAENENVPRFETVMPCPDDLSVEETIYPPSPVRSRYLEPELNNITEFVPESYIFTSNIPNSPVIVEGSFKSITHNVNSTDTSTLPTDKLDENVSPESSICNEVPEFSQTPNFIEAREINRPLISLAFVTESPVQEMPLNLSYKTFSVETQMTEKRTEDDPAEKKVINKELVF